MKNETPQKFHQPFFISSFLICAVIFILYSVAFGHNFFFDEESIILKNPFIRSFSFIPDIFKQPYFYEGLKEVPWNRYYRPLTTLSFVLDYHFWGMNPLGYNITNALIHCLVCVLILKLVTRFVQDKLAAFLAVFLYAVHPAHSEAVTYIASRGDLIGTALILASILLYWNSRYTWAIIAQSVSLFAKESTILIPLYILLLDVAVIKSDWKTLIKKVLPFALVNIAYILFRKNICPIPLGPPSLDLKEAALRVLSMGPAFLSYLDAIVYPPIFSFSLDVHFVEKFHDPQVFLTLFIVFLLLMAWILTWRYRGASFFGMSFFLVSFVPYLQIVHYYPEWVQHYLYIPAIGLTILFSLFIRSVLRTKNKAAAALFLTFYILFTMFFCVRTWQTNKIYNDAETYFDYLSKTGTRYAEFGFQNMGRIAIESGQLDKALVPLKTAEMIQPISDCTENFLGVYYLQKGRLEDALKHFKLAAQYGGTNPIYKINVSVALVRLERYEEAIEILKKVQKNYPEYASLNINLMISNELLDRPDEARKWGEQGIKFTMVDETEQATMMMAVVRFEYRQGNDEKAQQWLTEIVEKHSKVFWYSDIARVLLGKITIKEFEEFNNRRYFDYESMMHNYVIMALTMQKRWQEADAYLEKNKELFEKLTSEQPLLRKEMARTKEGIRLFKASQSV